MAQAKEPLYLGLDLSTQQLKALIVRSNLTLVHEVKVDFDADLPHYGTAKGVLSGTEEGELVAPVAMWLEAIIKALDALLDGDFDFSQIRGISGAGMQHGTVFWRRGADAVLAGLDSKKTLVEQLCGRNYTGYSEALTSAFSPNWQDSSTQKECDAFNACLGGPECLAEITGSRAHHRFSGPQILRFKRKNPEGYAETGRISLVSSYLASVFLGKVASIDISDVCGMNLWDIKAEKWHEQLLEIIAGPEGSGDLKAKLGNVSQDSSISCGMISQYFVNRYNFHRNCAVFPFTGDNPATMLALPLRASDAIVSLGTSTTFLMSTSEYRPDPAYHFMNHPTSEGLYMFMLCYKNGSLARELIRDELNSSKNTAAGSWRFFNDSAAHLPALLDEGSAGRYKMGLYFPRPEIVPSVPAGTWRFFFEPATDTLEKVNVAHGKNMAEEWGGPDVDARAVIESQFLSVRLRSAKLVSSQKSSSERTLPPQPRRIYVVGGASQNPVIVDICGQVLGSSEGVFRLNVGSNACALGAAYKAVWCAERKINEPFENFVGARWNEDNFAERIADGYREGVYEKYGEALSGLIKMEKIAEEQREAERNFHN